MGVLYQAWYLEWLFSKKKRFKNMYVDDLESAEDKELTCLSA